MIDLTREELLKIAQLSALQLDEDELATFEHDLKALLNYTSELDDVAVGKFRPKSHHVNVFRDDKSKQVDSELLLKQAPAVEDHYFVVPKILTDPCKL